MTANPMASLEMMRRVSEEALRTGSIDLTARQFTLLLTIFMRPGPHAVRDLAASLDLPKPAVTRALDVLEKQGLVRRKRDQKDKRDVSIHRTVKGAVFLYDYGTSVVEHARATGMIEAERAAVLSSATAEPAATAPVEAADDQPGVEDITPNIAPFIAVAA